MEAGPSSIPEIWGYLEPLVNSPNVHRINFTQSKIDIGRSEGNYATFTGRAVSKSHATIEWNGRRDAMSVVTITDLNTTNGTFVDGVKVAGINTHRLFDGCTVFFGSKVPVVTEQEDYRFTFHHSFGRAKTESLFNHYILGNCLGSGLHGHVYRAMEKTSGKVFAVKTSWHHDNKDSIMSAGQETMALMVMEYPHIVKLHEVFFRLDGQITDMVMEYVDGGLTLHNFIPLHLSETHAKELSIQLCLAVAFVHKNKISHGDLKPDNVLVTREDRPIIKVTDFGLADVDISYNRKPLHTDCIFTAPEAQSQGYPSNAQMQKWDDWAVGCLIFSLLSTLHAFPPGRGKAFDPAVDHIVWDALNTNSDEAQDLVRRFLVVNPHERVSVSTVGTHPWFSTHKPYKTSFESVLAALSPQAPGTDAVSEEVEMEMDVVEDDPPVVGKGKGRMLPPPVRPVRKAHRPLGKTPYMVDASPRAPLRTPVRRSSRLNPALELNGRPSRRL